MSDAIDTSCKHSVGDRSFAAVENQMCPLCLLDERDAAVERAEQIQRDRSVALERAERAEAESQEFHSQMWDTLGHSDPFDPLGRDTIVQRTRRLVERLASAQRDVERLQAICILRENLRETVQRVSDDPDSHGFGLDEIQNAEALLFAMIDAAMQESSESASAGATMTRGTSLPDRAPFSPAEGSDAD